MAAPADITMSVVTGPTGMTEAELKAVMAVNKDWSHPAEKDGWCLIHNAFRWDMDLMLQGYKKTGAQVAGGKPIEAWQVTAISETYERFYKILHHHHEMEEVIVFPYMNKRVTVPPKMTSDHKTLMVMVDELKDITTKHLPAAAARGAEGAAEVQSLLTRLQELFATMKADMEEHFKEEEEVGLPLLRKHFTQKEVASGPEKAIVKTLTPADLAYLMRPMPALAERNEIYTLLGLPGLVVKLVMEPAYAKDQATLVAALRGLAAGTPPPPPPPPSCSCTIM